jgi:putrescine aminotransferase
MWARSFQRTARDLEGSLDNLVLDSSTELYDAFEQRSWRSLAQRTRAKGLQFVLGRRQGPYVWDKSTGHRLLDCGLSGGVHSLGHRNPEVLAALRSALDSGLDAGLWHFPTAEMLAFQDKLASLAPSAALNRSVVTLSSTASIDLAVQFAARMTGRPQVLAYRHGYHGHAGFAAMVTGSREEGIAEYYGLPNAVGRFFERYGVLDDVAEEIDSNIAAIIVEPFDYETFAPPSPDYLTGLEALCLRHGALLIVDETRTGLGRSGRIWMSEHSGVEPDMLITGKGLGGGLYPISAVLTTEAIYEYCINGHPYAYASSMGGNEISTSVGLRVLDICGRPSFLEGVAALSARFAERFSALCADYPDIFEPGSVQGGIATLGLRSSRDAAIIGKELFDRGVFCHSVSVVAPMVVKFFPVLTAPPTIADEVADALADFTADRS